MPSYYQPNKHIKQKKKRFEMARKEEARLQLIAQRTPKTLSTRSALIGRMVAEARARAGLTQAKLSEAAGTTQSVIARIEKGRHNLTIKKLETIATALGKKVKIEID
jgi:ribosome-binding protein aMBF1 (putative translation factor)